MYYTIALFTLYHHYFSHYFKSFFAVSEHASWAYSWFSSVIMVLGYLCLPMVYYPLAELSTWQLALMDYNTGYFIADAYRIWMHDWKTSSLYFYHHVPPVLYTLFCPRIGFHYFELCLAESNLPVFNLDLGLRLRDDKRKTWWHLLLGLLNLITYFACRIVGIGLYIGYTVYYYGLFIDVGWWWSVSIIATFGFWCMFVKWIFKMSSTLKKDYTKYLENKQ